MRLPSPGTCAMVVAQALMLGTLASKVKAFTSVIFPGPYHGIGGLCGDTRCLEVTRCTRRYVESRYHGSFDMIHTVLIESGWAFGYDDGSHQTIG